MLTSLQLELCNHLLDLINDEYINEDNWEEAHHVSFNEDYYIVGYGAAENWLAQHEISPFHAIGTCIAYEKDTYGEVSKLYDDAETTVNMFVYVKGEELLASLDYNSVEQLRERLERL